MSESATAPESNARTKRVAWVGTILVAAYAAFAALEILVFNPVAAVPGRSLSEIYADVAAAGMSLDVPVTIGVLSIGPILALSLLGIIVRRPRIPAGVAAVTYLALLSAGGPALFVASFGAQIGLADTYGIGGGSYSSSAAVLYAASVLAVLSATAFAVAAAVRPARPPSSVRIGATG